MFKIFSIYKFVLIVKEIIIYTENSIRLEDRKQNKNMKQQTTRTMNNALLYTSHVQTEQK